MQPGSVSSKKGSLTHCSSFSRRTAGGQGGQAGQSEEQDRSPHSLERTGPVQQSAAQRF
jgi:hypothetical protein